MKKEHLLDESNRKHKNSKQKSIVLEVDMVHKQQT